jgi:hypothetical protein
MRMRSALSPACAWLSCVRALPATTTTGTCALVDGFTFYLGLGNPSVQASDSYECRQTWEVGDVARGWGPTQCALEEMCQSFTIFQPVGEYPVVAEETICLLKVAFPLSANVSSIAGIPAYIEGAFGCQGTYVKSSKWLVGDDDGAT